MQIDNEQIEVADSPATETNQPTNLSEGDLLNFLSDEPTADQVTETTDDSAGEETESEAVLSQSESDDTDEVEDEQHSEDTEDPEEDTDDDPEPEQPKSVQKLLKQIGRLTARSKSAEEAVDALSQQVESMKLEKKVESNPTIEEVTTAKDLEQLRKEALSAKKWARKHEDEDYVQEGDKEYTREEIKRIRDNAEEHLDELIPEREKFIRNKQQSDTLLQQDFKFINSDSESFEGKLWKSILNDPKLKVLDKLPNGNYLKALMVEGASNLQKSKQPVKSKGKLKPSRPKPPPPLSPNSDVSPPTRNTRSDTDRRKKILGESNISEEQLTAFLTQ